MAETIIQRVQNGAARGWNAILNKPDPAKEQALSRGYGSSGSGRPEGRVFFGERTMLASVLARMAVDVSMTDLEHVRTDANKRYIETIPSRLNECLTVSANIDQTGRSFLQDAALTLFNEGAIAIVPVDTTKDPTLGEEWDVKSLRVGVIKQWYPRAVRVSLYNDRTGNRQEVTLPKSVVAIVENPLYMIMNEPNSTLKRLVRKIRQLDAVDARTSSGKLDMLIQFPFSIKSDAREKKAQDRRDELSAQLNESEYGIGYVDSTEKVIQLNRPIENSLREQIVDLTSMLYSQLGITTTIMDGTADEATMINYYKRTIDPFVVAITEAMTRTFLSKAARTQGQKIMAFSDPFKLVPMSALADIIDKVIRGEVLSSNEVRAIMGFKPSQQEGADDLRNSNNVATPLSTTAAGAGPLPDAGTTITQPTTEAL